MKVKINIECTSCGATGIYNGMGEGQGTGVVCHTCKGTGKDTFIYTPFTKQKTRDDIERVYLNGYGYKLGRGEVKFDGGPVIDMEKEGISYREFLQGKMPGHIKELACPMLADQGACHNIDGFVDKCHHLGLSWGVRINKCLYYAHKAACWRRFDSA